MYAWTDFIGFMDRTDERSWLNAEIYKSCIAFIVQFKGIQCTVSSLEVTHGEGTAQSAFDKSPVHAPNYFFRSLAASPIVHR